MAIVSLSVCLSRVPDPKSRMEGHRKLKLGRKEARDPWPHLEVERSKGQGHQTDQRRDQKSAISPGGKAYELQTWYTDGIGWPAPPLCVVTSNLKAVGSWPVTACRDGHTVGHTACVQWRIVAWSQEAKSELDMYSGKHLARRKR